MKEVRNWKLKKVIRVVNQIADNKINQGVLLKELAHSIQAHQKEKTAEEWRNTIFGMFDKMIEAEREIIGNEIIIGEKSK